MAIVNHQLLNLKILITKKGSEVQTPERNLKKVI